MTTRSRLLKCCCLILGLAAATTHAQTQQQPEPRAGDASFWMEQKLRFSQNILTGLALADFDKIATNAESMRALNKVEAFVRRRPPAYRAQLRAFQFANDELLRAARKDNIDGATLAFTQITISCVNCHKVLREAGGEIDSSP